MRGALLVNWPARQIFDALGIFLGFTSNLIISRLVTENAWRWQMASLSLPTLILLALIYSCTESPRFQMKRQLRQRKVNLHVTWNAVVGWCLHWIGAFCCSGRMESKGLNKLKAAKADLKTDRLNYGQAYESLLALRRHPILAAKELLYVHVQMIVEMEIVLSRNPSDPENSVRQRNRISTWLQSPVRRPVGYFQKLGHLFTKPRIRRATRNAVVCMAGQQMTGVNVLAFYSSTLFASTLNPSCFSQQLKNNIQDASDMKPLWLSWGIGLSYFMLGLPAYRFIETRGRRWLLLVTTPGMTVSMLIACLSYLIPAGHGRIPTEIVFTYVFTAWYSVGMGPVPFTMSSEVFPLEYRMVGMSFSVFTNLFLAGIVALFVPVITYSDFSNSGLLAIFTALNGITFLLVFWFVRETHKARRRVANTSTMVSLSLEELTYIFAASTADYVKHQGVRVLPWAMSYAWWMLHCAGCFLVCRPRSEAPVKPREPYEENELQGRNTSHAQADGISRTRSNGHEQRS
ncbi:hypothetical protein LTR37_002700 [Vermiconidia calcicola]|uniref:Uncharacterized protein n=1 Tax=Vermiconidia calcicola TaxID=1690605 RepID=A0ACC3NSF5_9PEZI|nr:hypothetical protein LTR37_002700 [Vermiconidia calcicola]